MAWLIALISHAFGLWWQWLKAWLYLHGLFYVVTPPLESPYYWAFWNTMIAVWVITSGLLLIKTVKSFVKLSEVKR